MKLGYQTVGTILERLGERSGAGNWEWCGEYGEPGYSTREGETPMVVLGDYWCRCHKFDPDDPRPLHGMERHHPRLWAQLTDQGVEFEWYDEWVIDYETNKAYRTEGDSYSWMPSAIYTDDGDLLTPDSDIEAWIEYVKNDPRKCLLSRVWSSGDLIMAGFEQFNGTFESGWHPGQDDDPKAITEQIRLYHPDDEIVFLIDANGQFDTAFSAWRRPVHDMEDA